MVCAGHRLQSLDTSPHKPPSLQAEVPADSTVEVNLGCGHGGSSGGQHKHRVFVSTYLGYGTNQARTRYYQQLLAAHLEKR